MKRSLVLGLLPLCLLVVAAPAHADAFADARQLVHQGQAADALKAGLEALQADPNDVRLARLVQDLLLADGKVDEARNVARSATKLPYRKQLEARLEAPEEGMPRLRSLKEDVGASGTLRLDLAAAYLALGRARNAESELKGHLKAHAEDADAHELLGRARFAAGHARQAEAPLRRALELDPGRPSATIALAEVLHARKQGPAARTALLEAVERYRENMELLAALASDQVRAGEMEAAEKALTAVAAKRPDAEQALYLLGTVKRALGKLKEAEAIAKRLLELDPESAEGNELLGFVLEKQRLWEDALTHYLSAARSRPEWIEPLAGAAFVQLQLGELEYAEVMLESALELDEDHLGATLSMGILQFLRKKNRDAKKLFEKVLKAHPDDLRANRYLGFVLIDETKHKEAIACFEKVIEQDPSDAAATRMLGRAKVELGSKIEEAVELLERAVELDAEDPWNHFELGKAYEEQEEFEKAQEAYRKSITLDAAFAWPHLYLAELLDEVERKLRDALEHYQQFLELGGPDPDGEVEGRVKQLTGD